MEQSQTRAIGAALAAIHRQVTQQQRQASVAQIVHGLAAQMDGAQGLDAIAGGRGDCARPRPFEIAAALNRLRSLEVQQMA